MYAVDDTGGRRLATAAEGAAFRAEREQNHTPGPCRPFEGCKTIRGGCIQCDADNRAAAVTPKHTPGPWDVYDDSPSEDYRKGTCILTLADSREYEGGDRVATVERFTDSALIAAAPDMLSALKTVCWALADWRDGYAVPLEELKYQVVDRIIEAIEPGFDEGTTTLDEYRKLEAAYIVAAALAKAEGR
jgi:hypothetical protein